MQKRTDFIHLTDRKDKSSSHLHPICKRILTSEQAVACFGVRFQHKTHGISENVNKPQDCDI